METTRTLETSNYEADTESFRLCSIRWAAVIAGLAVGLGVHMLLLLIGAAAGLGVYGVGASPDGTTVSVAAAVWNSISLLVTAAIGGFVAARASGLRRIADGVLHAVASWGASMLFYAFLTSMVAGAALTGAVGMAAVSTGITASQNSEASIGELLGVLERGDRAASVRLLRERFNLTSEQAERVADRGLGMFGRPGERGTTANANLADAAKTGAATSAWLSVIILLSLAAGAGGGIIGARGSLKRSRPGHFREHHALHGQTPGRGIPTT